MSEPKSKHISQKDAACWKGEAQHNRREIEQLQSQLATLTAENQRLQERLTNAEHERQDALKMLLNFEAEANVKMDAVMKKNKRLRKLLESVLETAAGFHARDSETKLDYNFEDSLCYQNARATLARLKKGEE